MTEQGNQGQEPPEALPPPIPPAEMPAEELRALVDDGNVEGVAQALVEHTVRLPSVLGELDRILSEGLGNLAVVMATMLLSRFRLAQANALADEVLAHQATAGSDELVDLAAALIQQDRLAAARRSLDAAFAKEPKNQRGLYLASRVQARAGRIGEAFDLIARVSPKVLGPEGLVVQARFGALTGKTTAMKGALKLAQKNGAEVRDIEAVEQIAERFEKVGHSLDAVDLRAAIAIDSGSLLLELARDRTDGGRFDMTRMSPGDAARILDRIVAAITAMELPMKELLFANEAGEIVAEALSQKTGVPVRGWRAQINPRDGTWLCMGSSATHPHVPNTAVAALQRAIDDGVLRSLALVMPAGSRGPLVPDIIGRIAGDDELPFEDDDEVEDAIDEMLAGQPSDLADSDLDAATVALRYANVLRATREIPRPGHSAYTDEIPVARGV